MKARPNWVRVNVPSLVAFALPLALYGASMRHSIDYWDTGEMQTVPYILGIAHPTGFPVFTLSGWLFSHAVAFGSVAERMTFLCVLAMSVAAWCVYAMVIELSNAEPSCAWTGAGASAVFAAGAVAWTRGTRTEVHALALCFIALTLLFIVRWHRTRSPRMLVWAAVWFGLGLATHPVSVLLLPGLGVLVLAGGRRLSARLVASCCAAVILTLAIYAYFPIRSSAVTAARSDPTLQLGIAPGRPFWDYDHPASRDGFVHLVTGNQFDVGEGFRAIVDPAVYRTRSAVFFSAWKDELTLAGIAGALIGLLLLWRADAVLCGGLLLAGFLAVPFALGFRAEADIGRYFLTAFLVSAVLFGYALSVGLARLRAGRYVAPCLAFGLAVWLAYGGRPTFSQTSDPGARLLIEDAVRLTPRNAILIANWTYATPLAYSAFVERSLGMRIVETAWLGDDVRYLHDWSTKRPLVVVGQDPLNLPGARYRNLGGRSAPFYLLTFGR